MSLPPVLLQRLAQRGLVQKQKSKKPLEQQQQQQLNVATENEEVIAEDYDEMETADPSQYEPAVGRKRTEENFWAERMRARMGDVGSWTGYKGCPNKYNIWHKCTLYCVNRWAEGVTEPGRDYMRRYKRLLRKYPLPKGWTEMYDAGCGCFYFCCASENLVSWLPPTHPKSHVTKSASAYRRQMEEQNGDGGSDGEQNTDADEPEEEEEEEEPGPKETAETRHHREIDDIINASMRTRTPPPALGLQNFPSLHEANTGNGAGQVRKQKSRDLERTLSRQHRRDRGGRGFSSNAARRHGRDADVLDPMDPSAYSDTPRGKWSDGLNTNGGEERKKQPEDAKKDRKEAPARERYSDDDHNDASDNGDDEDYH